MRKLPDALLDALGLALGMGVWALHATPVFLVGLASGWLWWVAALVGLILSDVLFAGVFVSVWFLEYVIGVRTWLIVLPGAVVGWIVWYLLWNGMLVAIFSIGTWLVSIAPILSRVRVASVPVLLRRNRRQ